MYNYKRAFGFAANGTVVSKFWKHGIVAGTGVSYMFFPATCELARYNIQAGLGRNIADWRSLSDKDFPWIDDFEKFEAGLYVGIGVGYEEGRFIGSGIADADSFNGLFHTMQGMAGVGISGYSGSYDSLNNGFWIGGTLTFGPSIGVAKIDWNYQHNGSVIDLDDGKGFIGFSGRCYCMNLRISVGVSPKKAMENF